MPVVSVIIPVHNTRLFPETLDTVLSQSFTDFEVLVVDNGSDTDYSDGLRELVKRDERIKYIRVEISSAGEARNIGLRSAAGDYVAFWDSDDLFDPEYLQALVSTLRQTGADVALCDWHAFDSRTGERLYTVPHSASQPLYSRNELRTKMFSLVQGQPWDKLFRADFLRQSQLQFQDLPHTNDAYFVFSAMYRAEKTAFVARDLIAYRVNSGASIRDTKMRELEPSLIAFDSLVRDTLPILDSDEEVRELLRGVLDSVFFNLGASCTCGSEYGTAAASVFLERYLPSWRSLVSGFDGALSAKTRFRLSALTTIGAKRYAEIHAQVSQSRGYSKSAKVRGLVLLIRSYLRAKMWPCGSS